MSNGEIKEWIDRWSKLTSTSVLLVNSGVFTSSSKKGIPKGEISVVVGKSRQTGKRATRKI